MATQRNEVQPADRRTLVIQRHARQWDVRSGVELPLVEDDEWVAPAGQLRDIRIAYNRRAEGGVGVCARRV